MASKHFFLLFSNEEPQDVHWLGTYLTAQAQKDLYALLRKLKIKSNKSLWATNKKAAGQAQIT